MTLTLQKTSMTCSLSWSLIWMQMVSLATPPVPQCSRTSYTLLWGLGYKAKKIRGSYVGKNEGRVRSPRSLRPTQKEWAAYIPWDQGICFLKSLHTKPPAGRWWVGLINCRQLCFQNLMKGKDHAMWKTGWTYQPSMQRNKAIHRLTVPGCSVTSTFATWTSRSSPHSAKLSHSGWRFWQAGHHGA